MGAENINIGPCTVHYDGQDLGLTKGGVVFKAETETYSSTVDQFGTVKVNEKIIGRSCSATVPLVETTLDNLIRVMPGATSVGAGAERRVDVGSGIGTDLLAGAKKLILHPIEAGTSKEHDVIIHLASPKGGIEFAFEVNKERIFNVEFAGFIDTDTGLIFSVGDESASA